MLSLKYKNIVKTALFEENTQADNLENFQIYNTIMSDIHYFPKSIDNDVYVYDSNDKNKLVLYILTSLDYEHRLSGNTLKNNNIEIVDTNLNKNKIIMYQYYRFSILTIENHSGSLTYKKDKQQIRYVYNSDTSYDYLPNNPKFKEKFDLIFGNKRNVTEFIDNYIKDIFNIEIKSEEENNVKIKTPVLQTTTKNVIQSELESVSSVDETNDIKSSYDMLKDKDKENFMYAEKADGSRGRIRFTPNRLINDEKWRSVEIVKQKAEATLKDFIKINDDENAIFASTILYYELENANKGICSNVVNYDGFDLDTTNIDFHKMTKYLTVDPPELLSPMVVLKMDNSINWSSDSSGNSAKVEITKVFGDISDFQKGLIQFPQSSNERLIDSYALINNKKLGISTKGGFNGKGTSASISSLFSFLIDSNKFVYDGYKGMYGNGFAAEILDIIKNKKDIKVGVLNYINPFLSTYGNILAQDEKYSDDLTILFLFGGIQPKYHKLIIEYIYQHPFGNITLKSTDIDSFATYISTKSLTDLIMNILDHYKYKFCQVNCEPTVTNESFKYTYSVQYPAKFNGSVRIEKSQNGLKFHIFGE